MKERSRANTLLIELLLVIFFFMCSAGILVQVFANAKLKSREAHVINASMLDAENIAEELYHADNPDAVLESYGFTAEESGWELRKDDYLIRVAVRTEESDSGTLRTCEVSGVQGDKTLVKLPSTRYIPREVSP
jgi:hypothetical protein